MSKSNLILIGGGGHCQSAIEVIESIGAFKIQGILDVPDKVGKIVLGYEIIGTNNDIPRLIKEDNEFLITVGQIKTASIRKRLYDEVKGLGGSLATIIAKSAWVSQHAIIGEGTIVMHHALVNAGAMIGCNTIINSKSLIEHNTKIGNHCHISTAAIINGDVNVGNEVFVGSNATVYQGINIGEQAIVAAGAKVKDDITNGGYCK